MATILNIETATSICSVSIGIKGECVALKETNEGRTHAEFITVFIDEVIKKAGIEYKDLDAIAVSSGPGSYTGLRIGVSTAKGLCYALDKPLIAVSSLLVIASGGYDRLLKEIPYNELNGFMEIGEENYEFLFCPMIDARRMEVYSAFYDIGLEVYKPASADVINENSYSEYLINDYLIFMGDGAAKCKPFFSHLPNVAFYDDIISSAAHMAFSSENYFDKDAFEDLAYFEPFYLKDVNITKAKNSSTEESI